MRASSRSLSTRGFCASTLLVASCLSTVAATPCVIEGASIGKFDLRGLRNKKDYVASNPDGGAIALNFCGAVSETASPAEAAQGYGAYIEDTRGGISLGEYSTTPAYHNGQLSITYKNGATCPNSNAKRSSMIYLQCDNTWTGSSNQLTLIDSIDDCSYFFTMKTPYACPVSGGFFGAVWSILVSVFWLLALIAGGIFAYRRFFGQRGGQTLGGSSSDGGILGTVKDGVVVAGIAAIDMVQNLFNAVKSRRSANRGGDYQYNYNYQPAPAAAAPRGSTRVGGPDYSSPAWQASSAAGGANGAPPAPPAKGRQEQPEPHNPLAGGGSLLEDDEDDEDEQALAMPGTQQNGHAGNLV